MINSIKIPPGLLGIAVNSETNMIYLVYHESIVVIDGFANTIKEILTLKHPIRDALFSVYSFISINPVTNRLYLITADKTQKISGISVIDTSANQDLGVIPFEKYELSSVIVNPVTNLIYVTSDTWVRSGSICVIDGATNSITYKMKMPRGHHDIAINSSKNIIYVTNPSSHYISVYDGTTNMELDKIKVRNAKRIFASTKSNTLYVRCEEPWGVEGSGRTFDSLLVLDGKSYRIINKMVLGDGTFKFPHEEVYINTDADVIYVRSINERRFLKVDGLTSKILETVEEGAKTDSGNISFKGWKEHGAVNPVSKKVYLNILDSDYLYVMDG